MKPSVAYTLKVWQTAVFLAPALITIYSALFLHNGDGDRVVYLFGVGLGMFFSVPSAILFGFASHLISSSNINLYEQKSMLTVVGAVLTVLAFGLFTSFKMPEQVFVGYCAVYAAVIVGGVWAYQLKPETAQNTGELVVE